MIQCPHCNNPLQNITTIGACPNCYQSLSEDIKEALRLEQSRNKTESEEKQSKQSEDIAYCKQMAQNSASTAVWFLVAALLCIGIGLYKMFATDHSYSKDITDLISATQGVGFVSIGFVLASVAAVFVLFSIKNLLQIRIKQAE